MSTLQEIYDNLQKGKVYGYYYALRFPVFHYTLYLTELGNIGWTDYGAGANENTLEELSWILEKIFKTTPEQFLEKYEMYDEDTFHRWEEIATSQNTREYREWRSKPDGT